MPSPFPAGVPGAEEIEALAEKLYNAMPEKGVHDKRGWTVAWESLSYATKRTWLNGALVALDSVRSSQPAGGEGVREIVGYMREAYRQIDHEAGGGEVSAEWVATRLKRWADGLAALSPPEAETLADHIHDTVADQWAAEAERPEDER